MNLAVMVEDFGPIGEGSVDRRPLTVFVVAATNFEQALDPAIWRRFDDVLRFGLPDPDALDTLIRRRCRPVRVSERQIRALLEAVAGATFADAERMCLDVLMQAQSGGSAPTMDWEGDAV